MPLASQLSSLFSAGSPSASSAASPATPDTDSVSPGAVFAPDPSCAPRHAGLVPHGQSGTSDRGSGSGAAMKSEDIEVEGRPPYLHVSNPSPYTRNW